MEKRSVGKFSPRAVCGSLVLLSKRRQCHCWLRVAEVTTWLCAGRWMGGRGERVSPGVSAGGAHCLEKRQTENAYLRMSICEDCFF